jgi:tRNA(Ile)-lysidine synthetase-like protein
MRRMKTCASLSMPPTRTFRTIEARTNQSIHRFINNQVMKYGSTIDTTTSAEKKQDSIKVDTMIESFPTLSEEVKPVSISEFSESIESIMYKVIESERTSKKEKGVLNIALAISGGVDSMSLVVLSSLWHQQLLKEVKSHVNLMALTIDHKKRPESSVEVKLVEQWVNSYGIPIVTESIQWQPEEKINQRTCRDRRYQIFSQFCFDNDIDILLLGHHMNDQIEVFLYRLSMCSGISGLSGTKRLQLIQDMIIGRPLLPYTKERLMATCIQHNQKWVNDPTNDDPSEFRGLLRNVLPHWRNYDIQIPDDFNHIMGSIQKINDMVNHQVEQFYSSNVKIDTSLGYVIINLYALINTISEELAYRILDRAIKYVSNTRGYPTSLTSLKLKYAYLKRIVDNIEKPNRFNLGFCHFVPEGNSLYILHEAKNRQYTIECNYDEPVVFDGRYLIEVSTRDKWSKQKKRRSNSNNPKTKSNSSSSSSKKQLVLRRFKRQDDNHIFVPSETRDQFPVYIREQMIVIEDKRGILAVTPGYNFKRRDSKVYWHMKFLGEDISFEEES